MAEIFNIAVAPKCQQQGIGSSLLRLVLTSLAGKGVHRVELGTGSFGHQLTYYQRHGFRVDAVVRITSYPLPGAPDGARNPAQGYAAALAGAGPNIPLHSNQSPVATGRRRPINSLPY